MTKGMIIGAISREIATLERLCKDLALSEVRVWLATGDQCVPDSKRRNALETEVRESRGRLEDLIEALSSY